MILVCPSCDARYRLVQAIEAPGRRVRCRKCAHVWWAGGADPDAIDARVAPAPDFDPAAQAGQGAASSWTESADPAAPIVPAAPQPFLEHTATGHVVPSAPDHAALQESLSSIYAREQGLSAGPAEAAAVAIPSLSAAAEAAARYAAGHAAPPHPGGGHPGGYPAGMPWPEPVSGTPDAPFAEPALARSTSEADAHSAFAGRPAALAQEFGVSSQQHATEPWAFQSAVHHPAEDPGPGSPAPEPWQDVPRDPGSAAEGSYGQPPQIPVAALWPEPAGDRHTVPLESSQVAQPQELPDRDATWQQPESFAAGASSGQIQPSGQTHPHAPPAPLLSPLDDRRWDRIDTPPLQPQARLPASHVPAPQAPGMAAPPQPPLAKNAPQATVHGYSTHAGAVLPGPMASQPAGPLARSAAPGTAFPQAGRAGLTADTPSVPVRRRRSWAGMAGSTLVILAAAGLTAFVAVERDRVARSVPGAAGIYAALGLPANPHGLSLRNVKVDWVEEDNQQELEVRGEIHNLMSEERRAPSVVVDVRDRSGANLFHVVGGVGTGIISKGGFTRFTARIPSPPAGIASVAVHFPMPK